MKTNDEIMDLACQYDIGQQCIQNMINQQIRAAFVAEFKAGHADTGGDDGKRARLERLQEIVVDLKRTMRTLSGEIEEASSSAENLSASIEEASDELDAATDEG